MPGIVVDEDIDNGGNETRQEQQEQASRPQLTSTLLKKNRTIIYLK